MEVLNDFKIEECYTLAHARSLPKETLEKMTGGLNSLLKGRFLETIRCDRKIYIKTAEELNQFVEESYKEEELQRNLKIFLKENPNTKTLFQVRDVASKLSKKEK